jgi:transcription-repair coupling factor (superfamily II helicase)
MRRIGGAANEAAAIYFVMSRMKTSANSVFVVEDDIDVDKIFQIALSLKQILDYNLDIIKFDLDKDNQAKAVNQIYLDNGKKLVISSSKSVLSKFPSKKAVGISVRVGEKLKRNDFIQRLSESGFSRTNFVEKSGEFAIRGSVIDVFSYGSDYPSRIYLDGDLVEAIRKFEIDTQNTFDFEMELDIMDFSHSTTDLLSLSGFDFYSYNIELPANDYTLIQSDFADENCGYFENIKFVDLKSIDLEIKRFSKKDFSIYIFSLNDRENTKIFRLFEENNIDLKKIKFMTGYLPRGFYGNDEQIVLLSSNEIFLRDYDFYSTNRSKAKKFFRMNELEKGDFVVHEDHGIGIYRGIMTFTHRDEWGNVYQNECIEIDYAKGDKLFVPLNDFKKITKYVGSEGRVKISSLNSAYWKNVKDKIKKEIETVAKDILVVEAKRQVARIKPMMKTGFEEDFELDFGYDETDDQKRAIFDVITDLESGKVSNRVIVGDVGFGKTEVAMRAAFRVVSNGFQCAVLCPTTILAEQHYRNFKKRFEKFQINVEVISRLTPQKKQKKIISDLSKGVIDIIIGTHKLLSNNIKFKNLGQLVVDEEHKFGVRQKEIIKKNYNGIHILYLSATPIPRTLYQSISSIRTMSVIETPPVGRLSVDTKVMPYDDNVIISAVTSELKRGGQIYYVYNRVEMIENRLSKLENLLPGVKIAVVHGQMSGDEIEDVMIDFMAKKYDMLLASTIIESGIDIPSVNTLIVEDAHKLGLAQLYQLRGRIGREKQKAYCYLFFPKWLDNGKSEPANADMMKRLYALEEFSELGSGFRLAMRDLEIRGAGELLGTKQHGFIAAIGLDMYIRLLNNEVSRLKGENVEKDDEDVVVDINVSAYIPEDYINDDMERLNFYKRLWSAKLDEVDAIAENMKDLAGPLPESCLNLIKLVKVRKLVKNMYVKRIIEKDGKIEFYFSKDFKINPELLSRWQNDFSERMRFFKTSNGDGFEIVIDKDQDRIKLIEHVFIIGKK